MAASSSSHVFVDIAFAEKPIDLWSLNSAHFPSKVGGKPSWLSMKNLPKEIKCSSCNKQMIFLLQVYSPREDENTFHRTLFLFICNNESCINHQAKVFRCQLPRINPFYSNDPPSEDPNNPTLVTPKQFGLKTCIFCGSSGHLSCSKCNKVSYCSKDHQIIHWKSLGHKESCGKSDVDEKTDQEIIKQMLFTEYELTLDLEENYSKESNEKSSEDLNFQDALKKIKPTLQNEDLESVAPESKEDKCFAKFRSICSSCPDHVLRYVRNENTIPLWATDVNQINSNEIDKCNLCGSERKFEFQVMPQLISLLGSSFKGDFATLIIYTCKNSCNNGSDYKEEFVWKQMY